MHTDHESKIEVGLRIVHGRWAIERAWAMLSFPTKIVFSFTTSFTDRF